MEIDKKSDLTLTRSKLQTGVDFFVEKIIAKEIDRIYITSDNERENETVLLSVDEYEFLVRRRKEYERYKSLQVSSIKDILQGIGEDVEHIKRRLEK